MAITLPASPGGATETLLAAMRERVGQAALIASLRGAPKLGPAIPTYLLDFAAATSRSPLAHAKLVGWQFPIVDGEADGLASLAIKDHNLAFAGIAQGLLPRRMMAGANLAESLWAKKRKRYECRLLECPALRLYSLWLYSRRESQFIVLFDGFSGDEEKLKPERSILPRIRYAVKLARDRREASAALLPLKTKSPVN